MAASVEAAVAARIAATGPIGFDEFQEAALYGEGGFFASGGHAGRRGDFLTAPEVGPLFGAVLARALDGWWDDLGRPDPFVVVDAGAGPGTLARTVLAARPACAPALRYVLVERSAAQRTLHTTGLPLEPAVQAFAVFADDDADDDRGRDGALPGGNGAPTGPICVSVPDLPAQPFTGVIVANELLDDLPVRLFQRIGGRWWELKVVVQGRGFGLDEAPADEPLLDRLVPDAAEGAIVPLHDRGRQWVHEALGRLEHGVLVAFDYGVAGTADLAARPWTEWLRTYRSHGRGTGVLADAGDQDITCEVPFDQLPRPSALVRQDEWLRAHGIEAMVEEGRRIWSEQAARPGIEAIRMRSRVNEAAALLDPAGMGSFLVGTWRVGRAA